MMAMLIETTKDLEFALELKVDMALQQMRFSVGDAEAFSAAAKDFEKYQLALSVVRELVKRG